MDIKPGMIAQLKITAEPCFVLQVKPMEGYHTLSGVLSGVMAKVRRPDVGEHGSITHRVEEFFIDELETKEDASIRSVQEMETLKAQLNASREPASKLGSSN